MQSASPNIIDYANPSRSCPAWPRIYQIVMGLALFTVPEMFYRLYQPFNTAWLVKKFGCGCPDLRTGRARFPNANDISLVVYTLLALLLCTAFYLIFRRYLKAWPSTTATCILASAIAIILFFCLRAFGRGMWL